MKKLLIVILLMTGLSTFASSTYQATVERVIDGDTFEASFAVWELRPIIRLQTRIRVIGIDTPELNARTSCERELAKTAKAFAQTLLKEGMVVTIAIKTSPDKFNDRYDAIVSINGEDYAQKMINAGLAHVYNGVGPRLPWCTVP